MCNGETTSESTESNGVDILNDTLSELVESNSDSSGRVLDVKVSTTVRCKKFLSDSKSKDVQLNGSAIASDAVTVSKARSSCSTQTSFAEHVNNRYVVTNHISCECFCVHCNINKVK